MAFASLAPFRLAGQEKQSLTDNILTNIGLSSVLFFRHCSYDSEKRLYFSAGLDISPPASLSSSDTPPHCGENFVVDVLESFAIADLLRAIAKSIKASTFGPIFKRAIVDNELNFKIRILLSDNSSDVSSSASSSLDALLCISHGVLSSVFISSNRFPKDQVAKHWQVAVNSILNFKSSESDYDSDPSDIDESTMNQVDAVLITIKVSDIFIVPQEEEDFLLSIAGEPFNPDLSREDEVLTDFFDQTVKRYPTRIAIQQGDDFRMTYKELDTATNKFAHFLRSAKDVSVEKSFVVILMDKCIEAYVAILGTLKSGAGYVPLDPAIPADRVNSIVRDCDAQAIITTSSLAKKIPADFGPRIVLMDSEDIRSAIDQQPTRPLTKEETQLKGYCLAYSIYTSGSSGAPKGCLLQHSSICTYVRSSHVLYKPTNDERVWQNASLSFDASVEDLWYAWASGSRLVVPTFLESKSFDRLADTLNKYQITFFSTVPTLLSMLHGDVPSLKLLVAGGERLPTEIVTRFSAPGRRILNTYGPAEASVICTAWTALSGQNVVIGKALPNYKTYILDSRNRLVPRGCCGEICVAGPGVAQGYLNRDSLTAEKFILNPYSLSNDKEAPFARMYRTGDLGKIDGNGNIEYLGRLDSQVKLRGYRVELGEIEEAIVEAGHHWLQTATCTVYEFIPGVQTLVAFLVPLPNAGPENVNDLPSVRTFTDDITTKIRSKLPAYMIPNHWELLASVPTLPSGKVDRKSLPKPTPRNTALINTPPPPHSASSSSSSSHAGAASTKPLPPTPSSVIAEEKYIKASLPRNESFEASVVIASASASASASSTSPQSMQEDILKVWRQVFGRSDIDATENFFTDLGGHSLLAATSTSMLRNFPRFANLSVADVYIYPTAELLAKQAFEKRPLTPMLSPASSDFGDDSRGGSHHYRRPTSLLNFSVESAGFGESSAPFQGLPEHRKWTFVDGFLLPTIVIFMNTFISFMTEMGVMLLFLTIPQDGSVEAFKQWMAWILVVSIASPILYIFLSIFIKRLIIGKVEAGTYPLYSATYWKLWYSQTICSNPFFHYLGRTKLQILFLRALGAEIGSNVSMDCDTVGLPEMISIGDNTSLGEQVSLSSWIVENGYVRVGTITIGKNCYVGTRALLGINTTMEDGSQIHDLSLLPENATIPAGEFWMGSPPVRVSNPAAPVVRPSSLRAFTSLNGEYSEVTPDHDVPFQPSAASKVKAECIKIFFFFFIGYINVLTTGVTSFATVFFPQILDVNWKYGLLSGPISILTFIFGIFISAALKKIIIPSVPKAGNFTLDVTSFAYCRLWYVQRMMKTATDTIPLIFATIYSQYWARLMGFKMGPRCELSTISNAIPDLVEFEGENFVADFASVGAPIVHNNTATFGHVKFCKRSFVGNSSVTRIGTTLDHSSLIGVLSLAPLGTVPAGSSWLGCPGIYLPKRAELKVDDSLTYTPPCSRVLLRHFVDFWRIVLPLLLNSVTIFLVYLALHWGVVEKEYSLWIIFLVYPVCRILIGVLYMFVAVALKWILVGAYKPSYHPLMAPYTWLSALVSGFYEAVCVGSALRFVMGTPLVAPALRLFGCKIGKNVFINTPHFTEFDLVDIGHNVCLNSDSYLQTHLFEDRVMRLGPVKVENDVTVGGATAVLFNTQIKAGAYVKSLSLIMKGETVVADTVWEGAPVRPSSSMNVDELEHDSAVTHSNNRKRKQKIRHRVMSRYFDPPPSVLPLHDQQTGLVNADNSTEQSLALWVIIALILFGVGIFINHLGVSYPGSTSFLALAIGILLIASSIYALRSGKVYRNTCQHWVSKRTPLIMAFWVLIVLSIWGWEFAPRPFLAVSGPPLVLDKSPECGFSPFTTTTTGASNLPPTFTVSSLSSTSIASGMLAVSPFTLGYRAVDDFMAPFSVINLASPVRIDSAIPLNASYAIIFSTRGPDAASAWSAQFINMPSGSVASTVDLTGVQNAVGGAGLVQDLTILTQNPTDGSFVVAAVDGSATVFKLTSSGAMVTTSYSTQFMTGSTGRQIKALAFSKANSNILYISLAATATSPATLRVVDVTTGLHVAEYPLPATPSSASSSWSGLGTFNSPTLNSEYIFLADNAAQFNQRLVFIQFSYLTGFANACVP